jgi:hypothetical protein
MKQPCAFPSCFLSFLIQGLLWSLTIEFVLYMWFLIFGLRCYWVFLLWFLTLLKQGGNCLLSLYQLHISLVEIPGNLVPALVFYWYCYNLLQTWWLNSARICSYSSYSGQKSKIGFIGPKLLCWQDCAPSSGTSW